MYTIIVYWNASKYTTYEHLNIGNFSFGDTWVIIDLAPGHVLRIPSTTINRVETIKEDS